MYTHIMIKLKKTLKKKPKMSVFFKKEFWTILLSVGVQSANTKKRKTVFRVFFFGYRELFPSKSFFEWFGKNCQRGCSGIMWKNYISEKKCLRKIFFMKLFLNDTVMSTGTEERRQNRKIIFRTSFFNRESKWSSFWKVWYDLSTGYSGMIKVVKNYKSGEVVFLKSFFLKNLFSTTKLSVRVQRTDDTREKL